MKKIVRVLFVGVILTLSACSGELSEFTLPQIKLPEFKMPTFSTGNQEPKGFYDNLANEYENLASFEEEFLQNQDDFAHFSEKAHRASQKLDVEPDRPTDRNLPDSAIEEMQTAYKTLVDALVRLRDPENEALLAMAQTRYDCWLAHRARYREEGSWFACKNAFHDALALLDIPEDERGVYNVYFDVGSASLNEQGQNTLAQIAQHYVDRPQWYIMLKGYTDSKGNRHQNQILSMRRAIAVKNMLGQYGINLDNISISAEGEVASEDGAARESRRVEIRAQPQYTDQNKESVHILNDWRHSAEF